MADPVTARVASRVPAVQLALDFTEPPGGDPSNPGWSNPDPSAPRSVGIAPSGITWPDATWSDAGRPGTAWSGSGRGGPWPPGDVLATGLPEMDARERLAAELDILGMDASEHVLAFYRDFLDELATTASSHLLEQRQGADLLVAGVKVATQTPAVRSGRRVIFLTLDDGTGPVDATFFEDVQAGSAATVFASWLLVVRGRLRRTGPRGVSLRATGAWDLTELHQLWREAIDSGASREQALAGVLAMLDEPLTGPGIGPDVGMPAGGGAEGVPGRGRRVLVHASGFVQSPYADVRPAGGSIAQAPRKLWHASPGSAGR